MADNYVLVLREKEIRTLLTPERCLEAVERAFTAYATGQAELPAVINLEIPDHSGEVHVKSGYLRPGSHYAVKIASGFPGNQALGLPSSNGLVLVFDARTGALGALLLDNGFITDLRTGSAGAVAAKHLARRTVETVAVIGSGAQALYQIEALALVRSFREVRIWGRNPQKVQSCAAELARRNVPAGCKFRAVGSVQEAVKDADIVITVTASRTPLVEADWIAKGATIVAVGSDGPDKQELDVQVLARADRIVADSLPQCLRLGEIHHAVERGAISKEDVSSELGQITAGLKPGRSSEDETIVCDLTGVGVQDVAAASVVMERAQAENLGERLAM